MDKYSLLTKNHGKKKDKSPEETRMYRLMSILSQLANRKKVTTAGLAKQFGITKRSIQRDIELLSSQGMGFPIYDENDVYKFEENFSLRKIDVTPDEKLLLTLFYKLFSKAGQPLGATAKNLLNKVMAESLCPEQTFDPGILKIVEKEFRDYSNQLAVRLGKAEYPGFFLRKISGFLKEARRRVIDFGAKDNINIEFKFVKKYEDGTPAATILIPKSYFRDKVFKFDWSTHIKEWEFKIITHLPGRICKHYMITLQVNMLLNFWGVHSKAKHFNAFDEFAEYLGFPKRLKRLNYRHSYGARIPKHHFAITHVSLDWDKKIPMSREEMKPLSQPDKPTVPMET